MKRPTYPTTRPRARTLAGLSVAAALCLSAGVALADEPAPPAPRGLLLRAGETPVPDRTDTHAAARQLAEHARARRLALRNGAGRGNAEDRPARLVVQFDGPLTPARSGQLGAAGLKLVGYLPTNAYVVDIEAADADALTRLDGLRWVGEYQPAWKLDPALSRRLDQLPQHERVPCVATLFENASDAELLGVRALLAGRLRWMDAVGGSWTLCAEIDAALAERLAAFSCVRFIEEAPAPTLRLGESRWVVQSNIPDMTPLWSHGLTGAGQIIGLLDDPIDVAHCSFADAAHAIGPSHRKIVAYNGSTPPASSAFLPMPPDPGLSPHGTHVACIAVGDAGATGTTRGTAYLARFAYAAVPSYTQSGVTAALTLHHAQGARIHSNSWGDETTFEYTALTRGMDAFAYDHEDDLVVVAATNLTYLRAPENAKNVLSVGATSDAPDQDSWCTGGLGPTADGRRKPEVYAPGCGISAARAGTACDTHIMSGTSMATPLVAAVGALARQYFMDGFYPTGAPTAADAFTPSGALLRGVLINASVDIANLSGYPGNKEGWGRLLADRGLYFAGDQRGLVVRDVRNADGLSTGDFAEVRIDKLNGPGGTAGADDLRVTLVWTDPPAAVGLGGTGSAIVNNLDLEVVSPTGEVYAGNALDTGLGVSVPVGTAAAFDRLNTVEQVVLPSSVDAGVWRVRVKAAGVNVGTQGYALVVTGEIAEDSSAPPGVRVCVASPPATAVPGEPIVIDAAVRVEPGQTLAAGMPSLHARLASGGYTVTPMQQVGVNPHGDLLYRGLIAASACASVPEYFIEAQTCSASAVTEPVLGEVLPAYIPVSAAGVVLADDFELDRGWTVGTGKGDTATAGQWVRVEPIGGPSQIETDHTSGFGELCWITGQASGPGALATSHDVDAGFTSLVSPRFDLRGAGSATLSYWRWFKNTSGVTRDGSFRVEVSASDGKTWTTLEQVVPPAISAGSWVFKSFNLASFITLTDSVRVRFVAADSAINNSVCEAAVDDFSLVRSGCAAAALPTGACSLGELCAPATASGCAHVGGVYQGDSTICPAGNGMGGGAGGGGCCPADFNHLNGITVQDIFDFLTAWLAGEPAADFNHVNGITVQDIFDFLTAWLAGC